MTHRIQLLLAVAIIANCVILAVLEKTNGHKIVEAAVTRRYTPYQLDSGGFRGPTIDYKLPANITPGFDCSGLAQYSVFKGTGKIIARIAEFQSIDPQCHQLTFDERQTGDLIFFCDDCPTVIAHVGIVVNESYIFHSPFVGAKADFGELTDNHTGIATRCWD